MRIKRTDSTLKKRAKTGAASAGSSPPDTKRPSGGTPRRYTLQQRAGTMQDTRRRVVEAASAIFLDEDFQRLTVDAVAARAGVGRTTVFEQFGSKTGLLRAIGEAASERAGVGRLLGELGQPDVLGAVRVAFELGCVVWAAERDLFRKLWALSSIDADMRAAMRDKETGRRALCDELARRLWREGRLRAGRTRKGAADLLWLLTSFESFDALHQSGKSPRQAAALLLELASAFIDLG